MQKIYNSFREFFSDAGTVLTLFGLFILILGVNSFILSPAGITYETYPLIHFSWLIFGIVLVEKFAPLPIKEIRLSNTNIVLIIVVILAGLASSLPDGNLVARSIKIVEIIFQDLFIATTLATIGTHLKNRFVQVTISVAFMLLHVPLFFTEPLAHVATVVIGSLVISYTAIAWFVQSKQDVGTIVIVHLAFYLLFGSVLTVVFW